MTEEQIREELKKKGKLTATAMEIGISRSYLSQIVSGKQDIPGKVLDYLGLEVQKVYRRKDADA